MNLLIRADSSSTIGLGHIMRDLVFAAQQSEDTVQFACQNLSGNIIDKIPYSVHILGSNDPNELIALIREYTIDMVVFDHYGIDAVFEKKIKDACGVTILSFDDTYERHYCDILLNHNISADATRYSGLVPSHCILNCGAEYTLIRDEFKTEKEIHREKCYDLFIAMGGTDPTNATMKILSTLRDDLRVCVATTSGNPHVNELKTFVQTKKNITLEVDSAGIAQLLHQSHLAIITPSVMVHEVLFMDIPFIAIKTASNQEDMFVYLEKKNYVVLREWDVMRLYYFRMLHNYGIDQRCGKINLNSILFSPYLKNLKRN
jgi:UDP-2,4-diacetamido-2,4,6-trideoxy-beta-L-altropyranose hydrolase